MTGKRFGDWCEKHVALLMIPTFGSLFAVIFADFSFGVPPFISGGIFIAWFVAFLVALISENGRILAVMSIVGLIVAAPTAFAYPAAIANYNAPKVEVVCSNVTTNATTLVVINPTTTATITKATTKAVNSTYYEIASEVHTCP